MESIVKVKNLSFSYNNSKFIDDLSLEIEKGSYTCIMGSNGSGKTTLVKLIGGLLESNNGEIYIDDILLCKENLSLIRNKIGIVFQNPDTQYVGTTLKDDIIFGLENHGIDSSKMDQIIDSVSKNFHIEHLLDKEPYCMSGGEKQKGAIAGILALNPSIIILDEASSMLDPISKEDFKNIIQDIVNRGISVISITHDKNEVLNASRVILMDRGNIVFNGTKEAFFNFDVSKYNLKLPSIIEMQKAMNFENLIVDEKEFFKKLEGVLDEN